MISDASLKDSVLAELAWDPSAPAAHVGVTSRDGVITLFGHVERFCDKQAAQSAALRVKGVKAVVEDIVVRLPLDGKWTDEDIAMAAINRLMWDSTLPKDAVKVAVHKGHITLTGDVEWRFEAHAAEQDVRLLWGVVGVSNRITIKPRIDVTMLSADISRALHRSWFNYEGVKVTADGGKVTLTGHVNSWSERESAAATAWAAPGATDVENQLTIS